MANIEMNRSEIEAKLPHRGRALLLDRAEIITDENGNLTRAIGYRLVTLEDCEGHFPDTPIMKGFDRAEMIALTVGLIVQGILTEGYLPFLYQADGLKFPGVVLAGDLLRAEAELTKRNRKVIEGRGVAYVEDKLVAIVENITCLIAKKP